MLIRQIEIDDESFLCFLQALVNHSIKTALDRIEQKLDKLNMTDLELKALLTKIDTTTNHLASNNQMIADVTQKISDEIDAFISAQAGAISAENAAILQGIADRAQEVSDAGDAQTAVLQGIAAKGAPVVPAPPPTPNIA